MLPMTLPELFVLRHGETVWNREGRMQGALDSPLTRQGLAQARAIGALLAAEGVTCMSGAAGDGAGWRLLSSPQGRCRETARVAFGCEPAIDDRLAEIGMGDWAGLSRAEIAARWPGPPDEHFLDLYARIPNGESFVALRARLRGFLDDLDGPAVIVTHGMTSRMLRAVALGVGPGDVPGGQGVVHHLAGGRARVLWPDGMGGGAGAVANAP